MTRVLLVGVPVAIIVLALSLGAVIVARAQHQPGSYQSNQPNYGVAPTFSLVDQNGRHVSSAALAGEVQVVTYLFPYCRTFCPTVTHTLVQLQEDLRQEGLFGSKVRFTIFNVDPTGAGPAQMRAFLKQYGVHPQDKGWEYLTGPLAEIQRVVKGGYHVYFSKISLTAERREIAREKAQGIYTDVPEQPNPLAERHKVDYDVVHNDYVELVAPDGSIRQIFNGDQVSEGRLFTAVRALAVPNGS
jgi:cytochrome oxidase Cu insertion factor (SCO1/SenC/PrrC family)